MKLDLFAKSEKQFEVIKRSGGLTLLPASAYIDYEASVGPEKAMKFPRKIHEPVHILGLGLVPILFFEV